MLGGVGHASRQLVIGSSSSSILRFTIFPLSAAYRPPLLSSSKSSSSTSTSPGTGTSFKRINIFRSPFVVRHGHPVAFIGQVDVNSRSGFPGRHAHHHGRYVKIYCFTVYLRQECGHHVIGSCLCAYPTSSLSTRRISAAPRLHATRFSSRARTVQKCAALNQWSPRPQQQRGGSVMTTPPSERSKCGLPSSWTRNLFSQQMLTNRRRTRNTRTPLLPCATSRTRAKPTRSSRQESNDGPLRRAGSTMATWTWRRMLR